MFSPYNDGLDGTMFREMCADMSADTHEKSLASFSMHSQNLIVTLSVFIMRTEKPLSRLRICAGLLDSFAVQYALTLRPFYACCWSCNCFVIMFTEKKPECASKIKIDKKDFPVSLLSCLRSVIVCYSNALRHRQSTNLKLKACLSQNKKQ